ncbi:MAG: hypothetical protein HOB54_02225 [Flavobacteriales bacterium]|nr:hypothetical protein [Flavobacteriales bacterium]
MKDQAIYNTHPNVVEIINGTDCFDDNGNSVVLDDSKVAIELANLEAEYNAQDYARKRAIEYASLEEQADMKYWDSVNGTSTWVDHISAIKAKYPKS